MDDKNNKDEKPLETKLPRHPSDEPRMKAVEIMEEERVKLSEKHGVPKEHCSKRFGVWYVNETPAHEYKKESEEHKQN